ncbi:MAG: GWxTD domain-containing protein [Crocinitomicaceae bacterium]|nr:GWxTD domain-containing protein [Crocinitomicaceae bacterium]
MKLAGVLLSCLILSLNSFGQDKELRAYLDNKQFYAPGVGNYVEFHLQFVGYSLNYVGKDGGLIGEVAIQMAIHSKDSLVSSDAYRLSTPLMRDSIIEDFYDVKRFQLAPGNYTFQISLTDMHSDADPLTASQPIHVEELSDAISISDIEIAETATRGNPESIYYKSGFNIIPRLSTFYPEQLNTIPVYFEIYNSTMLEDSVFGLKQTVVNAATGDEVSDLTVFSKHYTSEVVPILRKVEIDDLATGKYILNYTLMNRNMIELSTQSYEFERSNDRQSSLSTVDLVLDPAFQESITNDSVWYYLESLIPISRATEVRNIIAISKSKDTEKARKHLQQYWAATTPINPYEGWIMYKRQVQLVERLYANNFQEGYETDRGRVYLQYGSPTNIVQRENSSNEYPYEIWQYNKIGSFSNKRFVFYNPDLVNNTYRLLHSDMIGELKNNAWPQELSKRNTKGGNVDNPNANVIDHWGGSSNDLYR